MVSFRFVFLISFCDREDSFEDPLTSPIFTCGSYFSFPYIIDFKILPVSETELRYMRFLLINDCKSEILPITHSPYTWWDYSRNSLKAPTRPTHPAGRNFLVGVARVAKSHGCNIVSVFPHVDAPIF